MTVDLDAIYNNIINLKKMLNEDVKFMGLAKGNGYGHGIIPVTKTMLEAGADYIAVAIPEEGSEIRRAGIDAKILVLGLTLSQSFSIALEYDLTLTVCDKNNILELNDCAKSAHKKIKVHLKIDSGMHRIGVLETQELEEVLDTIASCENIILEGVFTHFARADEADKSDTYKQIEKFEQMLDIIKRRGLNPIVHAANSAATLDLKQTHYDMVRPGIATYGYYPSDEVSKNIELTPAIEWKTKIAYIKKINKDDKVGYGRNYSAEDTRIIATIPVGYADGFKRDIGNNGYVLIRGQKAPVVGKVCMDQCMVDITNIKDAKISDEVILIGKSGKETISVELMAKWLGEINYEVLLNITDRVPRVYLSDRQSI